MTIGFQSTIDYLQSLGYCGTAGLASCSELVTAVVNGLKIDGFMFDHFVEEAQSPIAHRYLRGLQETVGGVNLVDVSLVMMCIIFAGLASGLTQVNTMAVLPVSSPTFIHACYYIGSIVA